MAVLKTLWHGRLAVALQPIGPIQSTLKPGPCVLCQDRDREVQALWGKLTGLLQPCLGSVGALSRSIFLATRPIPSNKEAPCVECWSCSQTEMLDRGGERPPERCSALPGTSCLEASVHWRSLSWHMFAVMGNAEMDEPRRERNTSSNSWRRLRHGLYQVAAAVYIYIYIFICTSLLQEDVIMLTKPNTTPGLSEDSAGRCHRSDVGPPDWDLPAF